MDSKGPKQGSESFDSRWKCFSFLRDAGHVSLAAVRGAAFRRVQGGHLDVDLDGEDWCLPGLEKGHPLCDRVNARRKDSHAATTKATITSQCRKFLVFLGSIGLLGDLRLGPVLGIGAGCQKSRP